MEEGTIITLILQVKKVGLSSGRALGRGASWLGIVLQNKRSLV